MSRQVSEMVNFSFKTKSAILRFPCIICIQDRKYREDGRPLNGTVRKERLP